AVLGGFGLLALIGFRAAAVWRMAGIPQGAHGHEHGDGHACCDHEHGHEHGDLHHGHAESVKTAAEVTGTVTPMTPPVTVPHAHHHHDHSHAHGGHSHAHGGHDHEHGWAPWRYMVMLVPVILGFLGLPAGSIEPYAGSSEGSGLASPTLAIRAVGTLTHGSYPLTAIAFLAPVRSGDYVPRSFKELEKATYNEEQRRNWS